MRKYYVSEYIEKANFDISGLITRVEDIFKKEKPVQRLVTGEESCGGVYKVKVTGVTFSPIRYGGNTQKNLGCGGRARLEGHHQKPICGRRIYCSCRERRC